MICSKCKKNEATTYVTKTINGVTEKYALCSHCAEAEGITAYKPLSFSDFFSPFFGMLSNHNIAEIGNAKRCPKCGMSFNEIVNNGKVGCAECYTVFYDELLPSIESIHGHTSHVGKTSNNELKKDLVKEKIKNLEKELKEAVEAQKYEEAAVLRDKINELKGENK